MKIRHVLWRFIPLVLVLVARPAHAGGPLYVGGTFGAPGVPFVWNINPVTYWTDKGNLGAMTGTQADDLVHQAFQAWEDVSTASISFSRAGQLGQDVTKDNIMTVLNSLYDCGGSLGSIARERSIIYDTDGSIIRALGGDPSTTLGEASAACMDSSAGSNFFTTGFAILNGYSIDGSSDSRAQLKAVMIHEFGHLIGLDHSQINLNCLTDTSCSSEDLEGLPTMFPILVDVNAMTSLSQDDIAWVSALYPESNFASSTATITGHILFSDGVTPAQGFNVIARQVANPRVIAVSSVSGLLFTADAGNPVYPWEGSEYGSRNTALIGVYESPGLPPGEYTLEVEAIYEEFVGGSGVGPIGGELGFQFRMPGTCTTELLNDAESASDACDAQSPVLVSAGENLSTGTDIILNGTPPRYDAWEDGP
jgi:hypothetical protein